MLWEYSVTFRGNKSITAWIDVADQRALEIFGGHLDARGAGVVDLATANGSPQQIWGFVSEAATPAMTVLFESNLEAGGSCLDVEGDDLDAGSLLEVLPCDSDAGNNSAQLWYPVVFGFPG